MNWLYISLGIIVLGVLSYIFREYVGEYLEMAWDGIKDAPSQIIEFASGVFSNAGEFSAAGLFFGIAGFLVVFISKIPQRTFDAFPLGQRIFWTGVLYIGAFVMSYLVGKRAFDM